MATSFATTSTKLIKTDTSTRENFTPMAVHTTNPNNIGMYTKEESSQNPTIDTTVAESSTNTDMTQNISDEQLIEENSNTAETSSFSI